MRHILTIPLRWVINLAYHRASSKYGDALKELRASEPLTDFYKPPPTPAAAKIRIKYLHAMKRLQFWRPLWRWANSFAPPTPESRLLEHHNL